MQKTKTHQPETAVSLRELAEEAKRRAMGFPQDSVSYYRLMKAAAKRIRRAARLEKGTLATFV